MSGEVHSPEAVRVILRIANVASVIVSAIVVKRCLDADWGWFWSLFSIVWTAPITLNVTSFLIGCVLWCHRKLTTSESTPDEQGSDRKPDSSSG